MYDKRPAFGQVKTVADQPVRHLSNAVSVYLDQSKALRPFAFQCQERVGNWNDRMTVWLRDFWVPVHLALAIERAGELKLPFGNLAKRVQSPEVLASR
ncbi:hypothetical protein DEM27_30130 [Metarhizobium album]|uniref:Uncharacterized protein n=1 Tax=Metarhizobium album TaxID=2182425 RepID=A0A2U2DGV9_9HYPH|nr:hypothetical protein DEM27_30130 [Rhizobium album]